LSRRHLEVGVGTGYLLQHGIFPSHSVELLLLDCNPTVLRHALRRLARYQPKAIDLDVMQTQWPDLPKQQSIGLNYVWHGLQGTPEQRGALFGRLARLLADDGVLFGATVRGLHPQMSKLARYASQHWLSKGFFNNQYDTPELVTDYLQRYFGEVEVWLRGEVILFIAKQPKHYLDPPSA
jgi:ubiquinone/menaquinone biosynthesis C-methylase UbiE